MMSAMKMLVVSQVIHSHEITSLRAMQKNFYSITNFNPKEQCGMRMVAVVS